jgi:hypothetical protein
MGLRRPGDVVPHWCFEPDSRTHRLSPMSVWPSGWLTWASYSAALGPVWSHLTLGQAAEILTL